VYSDSFCQMCLSSLPCCMLLHFYCFPI